MNAEHIRTFIELLKEEHTINNNLIPTIHSILLEATGYVEKYAEEEKIPKKQRQMLISKQKSFKQKSKLI